MKVPVHLILDSEGRGTGLHSSLKGAGLKPRFMATNPPAGDGHRNGMIRQRSQVLNPKTGIWTKRGPNGQFMDGKQDGTPFKGVRKEK